jgi:multiple sugar transport system substrate-binding protein
MKENKLSRRDFLRLISMAISGGVILAACAPQVSQTDQVEKPAEATEPDKSETQAEAPAKETVTIEYWTPWGTSNEAEIQAMAAVFEEHHPEIKSNLVIGGPGGGDFNELLLARIAAGNPPDMTTIWTSPPSFGVRGALLALDEEMATAEYATHDAFFTGSLQTCQFKNKTYALPHSSQAAAVVYDKTWLEEKGLLSDPEKFPKTWDEIRALSGELVEWDGDTLKVGGFIPFVPSESTVAWLYDVWSGLNGGQLYDFDNVAYTIDHESNIELLEYWLSWLDEQYKGDIDLVAKQNEWSSAGAESAFALKQTPLTVAGQWDLSYEQFRDIDWELEVARLPVGPHGTKSITGSWPNWMCVPTNAKYPKEGFLMAEAFSTYAVSKWYERVFDLPSWKDFPFDVLSRDLVANFGEEKARKLNEFWFGYREDAIVQWASPIFDFASDHINRVFDEVMHKVKSPAEGLAEAQQIVQPKLEETLASL